MALKKEKDSKGTVPPLSPLPQGEGRVRVGTVPCTIHMERSAEVAKGGPLTADVHPDEVANYEKAGWKRNK